MTGLSLRKYLHNKIETPHHSVRNCCAPWMHMISLRSLLTSVTIIHISDPHLTTKSETYDSASIDGEPPFLHVVMDYQNSTAKINNITAFLVGHAEQLRSHPLIITGDLTDSGEIDDYMKALEFIGKLESSGFTVLTVPGNHDYCVEGNQFLTGNECSNADEKIRRDRFLRYITPQFQHNPKYPHFIDLKDSTGAVNGRLILLDSMQGELDGDTDNNRSQGTLGNAQLNELEQLVAGYQTNRRSGKKLIVCLHHSPFTDNEDGKLDDRERFMSILHRRVDCLLFGHTGNTQQGPEFDGWQGPEFSNYNREVEWRISLINSENLERMGGTYPITVLDLGSCQRVVYQTDGSAPQYSWGNPPSYL